MHASVVFCYSTFLYNCSRSMADMNLNATTTIPSHTRGSTGERKDVKLVYPAATPSTRESSTKATRDSSEYRWMSLLWNEACKIMNIIYT